MIKFLVQITLIDFFIIILNYCTFDFVMCRKETIFAKKIKLCNGVNTKF